LRTNPPLDDLPALDKATLMAMLVQMAEQMEALKRELAITVAALVECQGRLALNSTNSSKPPSSDGLNKPKPKSQRQSGKRLSGGQPGHPGKTLRQVAEPDHVEQHGPAPQCDACGLMLQAEVVQVRQVFDLPAKRHEVTEHQLMQAQCQCGKVHRGVFPADVVAPVQYGPRVLAAAAYLNQHQMLPQQRSAELLGEMCGLPMSAATVQMATQRVQGQITPVVQAIRQALLGVPVLNADESGLRVMKLLQWLHVACTDTLVWMARHAKRGMEAFDALDLLPKYHGVLVHDGWQPYRDLVCLHALCNAHHLRELLFLAEEMQQSWALEMIDLLRQGCHEVNESPKGMLEASRLAHLRSEYTRILDAAEREHPRVQPQPGKRGRPKQSKATKLLGRLREHAQDVWRFASHALVPFTNNAAEPLMRMLKVKLKIAGTFRTEAGADTFCAIRSYLATMVRQGHSAFECLGPGAAGPDPSTPVQLIGGATALRRPTLACLSA
jgi:transposase